MKLRKSAVIVILCLAVVVGALLMTDGVPGRPVRVDRAQLLESVMSHLSRAYIDSAASDQLYSMAIQGMIRGLGDAHAAYIPPARYSAMRARTEEQAAGPGLDLDERDGSIVVVAPMPGSPASTAGVRAGDRISLVDGTRVYGMSAEEVRQLMQGSPGSLLDLTVERAGLARRLRFSVARELRVHSPVGAAFLLTSGVGYVRPDRFSAGSAAALAVAIDDLMARSIGSLIMDLRGNPSGLPEAGVAVADLFLPAGSQIASTRGRANEELQGYVDGSAARWANLELILLVDEGTANASEVTAGALQDLDRALVLGHHTFGSASNQEVITLSDGGALMLTTSRWYTPLGRRIEFQPMAVRRVASGTLAADTLRPEFMTASGRTVLGGGGIRPDVVMKKSDSIEPGGGPRSAELYTQGNAQELIQRDAAVRVAISLANLAQGQADLFAKAQALDAADLEDGGSGEGSNR